MTLVLLPGVAVALVAVFAVVAKVTRTASAGSLAIAVVLPAAAAALGRPGGEVAAFAACSLLVVARHRDNIARLRRGHEATIDLTTGP
jgi:glycerol-3-phosphate acyltransferase PlsY